MSEESTTNDFPSVVRGLTPEQRADVLDKLKRYGRVGIMSEPYRITPQRAAEVEVHAKTLVMALNGMDDLPGGIKVLVTRLEQALKREN